MIIPTTYLPALLVLILSALLWGSWANTQKANGKGRFELYYYDFTWGILIAALVAAFTFGSLDPRELTFQDNLLLAGYRKMAWAVGSGVAFNLGNVLLAAAIAVAGMSLSFPIVYGLGVVVGIVASFALDTQTASPALYFGGAGVVLIAVCASAIAYSFYVDDQQAASQKALSADPRAKGAPKRVGAAKGIVLSILGGLFVGASYPMLQEARSGENGVAPYGLMLFVAAGMFLSSIIYVPFFLNFPVIGKPLPISSYFRATKKQHLLGVLGGILWMSGGVAYAVTVNNPALVQMGAGTIYAIGQGATIVSVLWGLMAWGEYKGSTFRVKMILFAMMVLFAGGLTMIAIAPSRGR